MSSTFSAEYRHIRFLSQLKSEKGENVGRTFKHDFVVLGYHTIAIQLNSQGFIPAAVKLPTASVHSQCRAIASGANTPEDIAITNDCRLVRLMATLP